MLPPLIPSVPQVIAATEHKGSGTLWTGHADGSIRAFMPNSSEAPAALRAGPMASITPFSHNYGRSSTVGEGGVVGRGVGPEAGPTHQSTHASRPLPPTAAITALWIGEDGIVWAGDEAGCYEAVMYDPTTHSVKVINMMKIEVYVSDKLFQLNIALFAAALATEASDAHTLIKGPGNLV